MITSVRSSGVGVIGHLKVQKGDTVQQGDVLGSIQVLNTPHPIKADVQGIISSIHISVGDPVEYNAPIMFIDDSIIDVRVTLVNRTKKLTGTAQEIPLEKSGTLKLVTNRGAEVQEGYIIAYIITENDNKIPVKSLYTGIILLTPTNLSNVIEGESAITVIVAKD